jgi:predicted phosphodiesterase
VEEDAIVGRGIEKTGLVLLTKNGSIIINRGTDLENIFGQNEHCECLLFGASHLQYAHNSSKIIYYCVCFIFIL